jgi:hypothetical protein
MATMRNLDELPEDHERILERTAAYAMEYDNYLKWNEVAELRSDMMKRMDRRRLVPPKQVEIRYLELGMT